MKKKLICVICGNKWGAKSQFTNRCENCKGFCSWGYELNKPESFDVDDNGKWHIKQKAPPNVSSDLAVDECKCIRFAGGNKWYPNGCKIHPNG